MKHVFTKEEIERYSRHLILPEFNIAGQTKLKNAKVLVVGTGGLGSPLLYYLTAAGVGNIGIIDFDTVDHSNLQRQVLFTTSDIGKPKALTAANKLQDLNPNINFKVYNEVLNSSNALDIISEYDVVADGTDNFPTRYLVNDSCVLLNKTNVYASIFRFDGQVSVFNYTFPDGSKGPHYRDLFPAPPPPGMVPSCAEGGVLGVLPGIVGSIQANEVIKVITGIGEPLAGRLFLFDALNFETRTVKVHKNPETPEIKELIDYEEFCGIPGEKDNPKEYTTMKEVTVAELAKMKANGNDFELIDCREPYERDIAHIEGQLIPMGEIERNLDAIPKDKQVIIYCRSGRRSGQIVEYLESKHGYDNLYNLVGGILAWSDEVDPSIPKY